MPYVRDYNYDVFVSYSLVNDELTLDGAPWVAKFVAKLKTRLKNLLPDNGKEVEFYYAGKGDLRPGEQLASCREEARRSALFLIMGSPRYLDFWPTSELREFGQTPGADKRIFVAELLPLPRGKQYPNVIGDPFRSQFWEDIGGGAVAEFSASVGEFDKTLNRLAGAICDRLSALHERSVTPPATRAPNPDLRPVLLARATDDIEPLRQQLRTYLDQFEIPVIPAEDFEEEGAAFRDEYTHWLGRAPFVIQLLGAYPARRTRDLPDGFDGMQAQLARARAGAKFYQWRDPELNLATIEDERHRALLTDRVCAMDLESFKEMIVREIVAPPPPTEPCERKGGSFLFIDADQTDADTARRILRECRERKIVAMMPEYGIDTPRDWRANYAGAERIAVIHCHSNPQWLTAQLRLFVRTAARPRSPQHCLIYLGGPPPKEKESLTVAHPGFEFVEAPDGDLGPLLDRLG